MRGAYGCSSIPRTTLPLEGQRCPPTHPALSAKKKGRRARLFVIVLVLALVAGIGYGAYWSVSTVRASFPQTTGSLQLKGLSGPVDVRRDSYGIPQIYANTDADLFRAQGYVQAQDRFYEMDVRRHMTSGRLSEMFGKGQVKTDTFLRTLGWHEVAQKEYDTQLSAETKKYLQSYADGVNAYLKGRDGKDISVEYAALSFTNDYKPEKWTPVDSVAWLKAMAWDLRGNMQDEIDRSLMTSRLSQKQIDQLYPAYPYDRNKPIVREGGVNKATGKFDPETVPGDETGDGTGTGTDPSTGTGGTGAPDGLGTGTGTGTGTGIGTDSSTGTGAGTDTATNASANTPADAAAGLDAQLSSLSGTLDDIPQLLGPNGNGIGSNSWVVRGNLTTTGKPLLANDPHLAPQLPSLWYQMGLHCRSVSATCQYDVAGYTFSGMPGVVIGHNQNIAWGMTNLGADVTDLYLEKVNGDGYQYGTTRSSPSPPARRPSRSPAAPSKKIIVRSTNNGPIVSDRNDELAKVGKKAPVDNAAPDRGDGYAVALRWTALTAGKSMDAGLRAGQGQGLHAVPQGRRANFDVPSQNLIYADTDDNIGYQAPGTIPIRGKGDGTVPAPGWDPAVPLDQATSRQSELPYEYNPKRGYIVTANQAVVDAKKYPYLLTTDWGYGTRSQRINDLIESKIKDGGKISTDDMQTMQMDNSSEIAKAADALPAEDRHLGPVRPRGAEAAGGLGLHPGARLGRGRVLQRGLAQHPQARLRQQAAQGAAGRGPVPERRRPPTTPAPPTIRTGWCASAASAPPTRRSPTAATAGSRWSATSSRTRTTPGGTLAAGANRPGRQDPRPALARAMKDARWELTAKLGKDIDTWSWGRLHQLELKNQTLGTDGPGFLKCLLNRGPWNLGGGEAAVDATGWNAAGGYSVIWVPSMRMVVNLADLDKSRWINLTGASGHAYSAHYTDQTDKWAKGELLPWSFGPSTRSRRSSTDTLQLRP